MTGNLDEKIAKKVFDFFLNQVKENKQSVIFVTHNKKYSKKANFQYEISNHRMIKI